MSGRFNLADYITVDERIDAYWAEFTRAHGSIQTDIVWVNNDGTSVAIKATVYWDERVIATGIAQEDRLEGLDQYGKPLKGANATSWWENAETSAIGRALANMGMSLSKQRPSREEMQKVERGAERAASTIPAAEQQATRNQNTPVRPPAPPGATKAPVVAPRSLAPTDEAVETRILEGYQWLEAGREQEAIIDHIEEWWDAMTIAQQWDVEKACTEIKSKCAARDAAIEARGKVLA